MISVNLQDFAFRSCYINAYQVRSVESAEGKETDAGSQLMAIRSFWHFTFFCCGGLRKRNTLQRLIELCFGGRSDRG